MTNSHRNFALDGATVTLNGRDFDMTDPLQSLHARVEVAAPGALTGETTGLKGLRQHAEWCRKLEPCDPALHVTGSTQADAAAAKVSSGYCMFVIQHAVDRAARSLMNIHEAMCEQGEEWNRIMVERGLAGDKPATEAVFPFAIDAPVVMAVRAEGALRGLCITLDATLRPLLHTFPLDDFDALKSDMGLLAETLDDLAGAAKQMLQVKAQAVSLDDAVKATGENLVRQRDAAGEPVN